MPVNSFLQPLFSHFDIENTEESNKHIIPGVIAKRGGFNIFYITKYTIPIGISKQLSATAMVKVVFPIFVERKQIMPPAPKHIR